MTRRGYWCVTGLLALGCLMPKAKLLDKPDGGGGGGVGGEAGADAGRTGEGGALGGQSTGGATGGASGSGVTGGAGGTAPSAGTGGGAATAGGTSGAGGSSTGGGSAEEAGFGGQGGNDGGAGVVGFGGASGSAGAAGTVPGGSGVSAGETGQGGDEGAGGSGVGGAAGTAGANSGGAGTGGATPVGCGPEGPSCAGGLTCGDGSTSCCKSVVVEGGSYEREPGETPSYPATVSSFCLDKYEVTVGRFRKFLAAYDQWHQTDGYPRQDDGEHPVVGAGSGWDSAWDTELPTNATVFKDMSHLNSSSSYKTWRDTESATGERLPINYVNWYEAFAFCIWDGGRLPTEAEWQYAAQGGNRNWDYPWGDEAPTSTRAVYDCMGDGSASDDCAYADILAVGSKPSGNGYWQQSDLAGSMWEWNLDWYATYSAQCDDCANTQTADHRVTRGGHWNYIADYLRAAYRWDFTPAYRYSGIGFRCARTPK